MGLLILFLEYLQQRSSVLCRSLTTTEILTVLAHFLSVEVILWSRYQEERGTFSYPLPIRMMYPLSGGPTMLLDH